MAAISLDQHVNVLDFKTWWYRRSLGLDLMGKFEYPVALGADKMTMVFW